MVAVEVLWRWRAGLCPCEVGGLLEKMGVAEVSVTCAFGVRGRTQTLSCVSSQITRVPLERGGDEDRPANHWWHKGPAQV